MTWTCIPQECVMSTAQSLELCLWRKIGRYASRIGRTLIQKALWLYYAAQRPQTPIWAKTTIYAALGYFILPLDMIPDLIPGAGYVDDLGLLTGSVVTVAAHINAEVREQASARLADWFGSEPQ
ncbi:YkvA family protein [Pseudomonas saponiphila]|nr:YkvA family protein [Pseudomonas saponiphila]